MVNATEMAKIFDTHLPHFMENAGTQKFIESCLNSRNSDYLNVGNKEDLIISKQKSGTWMHRVLALKFAAWLSSDFEVWVYKTIDDILFSRYKQMEENLKKSAQRKREIEELNDQLLEDERFKKLQRLQLEERQAAYTRSKEVKTQLDLFMNQN